MPKFPVIDGATIVVAPLRDSLRRGIVWGCVAGTATGFGFVMNIDFFTGSPWSLLTAVLLFSASMGAVFGHAMAAILIGEVAVRRIPAKLATPECLDLSEHKALKLQVRAHDVPRGVIKISYGAMLARGAGQNALDGNPASHRVSL